MGLLEDAVAYAKETQSAQVEPGLLEQAVAFAKGVPQAEEPEPRQEGFDFLGPAKSFASLPEQAFQLAGAGATWLTGELGALAHTGIEHLRNAAIPDTNVLARARGTSSDLMSAHTPSLIGVSPKKSSTQIAQEANFIRESVPKIMPQPIFQKTQETVDAVGKTIEKLSFWHEPIIKGFDYVGMPEIGPIVNFVFDLAAFKGAHKVGTKAYSTARKLKRQIDEGKLQKNPESVLADLEKELKDIGLTKEDLSTPEARQAWIDKQPELAKDYGPSVKTFQTADWLRRDRTRPEPVNPVEPVVQPEPVPEFPGEPVVVSGAKTPAETNLETREQQQRVQQLRQQVEPQSIADRDLPPEARRILEAAQRAPKTEPPRQIPPEVSGLDRPVMMTSDGRLFEMDGRELVAPGEAKPVETARPVEPVAEPVVEPTPVADNSHKNLIEVGELKAEKSKGTPIDLDRLDDWVEIALEDLYKEGGTTRLHTIAKQLLETGELDSPGLVKSFKKWYDKQAEERRVIEAKEEPPPDATRVDPETGRPPGQGIEAPPKKADLGVSDIIAEVQQENSPLMRDDGTPIKSRAMAVKRAEALGRIGEVVKNPKGEGWIVKPTKEQRKQLKKKDLAMWDKILEQEGLTVEDRRADGVRDLFDILGDESGVISPDLLMAPLKIFQGLTKSLKNERGEVRLSTEDIRKATELFRSGKYDPQVITDALVKRGLSPEQIDSLSGKMIEKAQATGESKWLRAGQDPNEPLPRREKANGKLAPEIKRGSAHNITQAKEMDARTLGESWSLETSNRGMERAGEAIQKEFQVPLRKATAEFQKEKKRVFREVDKLAKQFTRREKERIYSYATQLQEGGKEILQLQGKEVVTQLTPKELAAYEKMRADFKGMYDRLNAARKAAGEPEFPAVDNYFTLANDIGWLRDSYGIGLYDNYKSVNGYLFGEHKTTPTSYHTKSRATDRQMLGINLYLDKAGHSHKLNGEQVKRVREYAQQVVDGEVTTKLTPEEMAVYDKAKSVVVKTINDPFAAYKRYMNESLDYIHRGPELARQKELLSDRYGLHEIAPNTHLFLSQWRDSQTGMKLPWDITNLKWRRRIQRMNKNVVMGYLAGAPQSALRQVGAFPHTYAIAGQHTFGGILDAMSPAKWKMAWEKSDVLHTRSPEVSLDIARGYESQNKIVKGLDKASEWGLKPLDVMDKVTATASWLSFYRQAHAMKQFTTDAQRVRYADDWTAKTQGSASMLDRAPIQRSLIGGTATGLQTFAINEFNFIAKDVLGIKNPEINAKTKLARTARFVAAVTLFNWLQEEVLGMNAGAPTPVKTAREKADELGKDGELEPKEMVQVGAAGLSELANYIPLIGSALKYDTQLGGPTVSLMYEMASDLNKKGTVDPKDVATLLGRGDVRQALKMHEAYERNGSVMDIMLGNYVPKPREKKGGPVLP